MIRYNGFDIPTTSIDGVTYLDFNMFLLCHRNFSGRCDITYEAAKLPKNTWIKVKKYKDKRNVQYYINGKGLLDFIQRSISMVYSEKKGLVEQMLSNKMIQNMPIELYKRNEIIQLDALKDFFSVYHKKVESQVPCGQYIIDFVIDSYAIEYDENDHRSYDGVKEKERESIIINAGYKIIRISDKNSHFKNLAIVSREII